MDDYPNGIPGTADYQAKQVKKEAKDLVKQVATEIQSTAQTLIDALGWRPATDEERAAMRKVHEKLYKRVDDDDGV